MKIAISILIILISCLCQAQTVNDLRPTVTMKEYVDNNVEWQQRFNNAQLASLKEANELVRLSLQEYKTVNNEWRGQLKDQAATFVTWPALIGLIFGISGLIFGYANYMKGKRENGNTAGKNIVSGDKVEVKK